MTEEEEQIFIQNSFGSQFNVTRETEKTKKQEKKKVKVIKNVTASIIKVTQFGDVIIKFNSSVVLKKEEISLELEIEPAEGRSSKGLEFNWTYASNTSDTVTIKIVFENPV